MTNKQAIREAINNSIDRDEIVHVTVEVVEGVDLHDEISAAWGGEWDCPANWQSNDGPNDVWSVNSDTPWRIVITMGN